MKQQMQICVLVLSFELYINHFLCYWIREQCVSDLITPLRCDVFFTNEKNYCCVSDVSFDSGCFCHDSFKSK